MGAKTGLLVYADGSVPELLRRVDPADPERTPALIRRLYPGHGIAAAPLDLAEDALRALCGFVQEGRHHPDDVNADAPRLHGSTVQHPAGPTPAHQQAEPHHAAAALPPPRF